jgi:hypothetical protein
MKYTKTQRRHDLIRRLENLGFNYSEIQRLRRIEMTLSRWSEAECNGEIERNEKTGKPERVSRAYLSGYTNKRHAWPVPDREAGALRRLKAIVTAHPDLWYYHQGDPRGCSLYVGRKEDIRTKENMVVRKAVEYGLSAPVKSAQTVANHRPLYESTTYPGFVDDTPEGIARRYLREKGITIPNREFLPLDQYYTRGVAVCD